MHARFEIGDQLDAELLTPGQSLGRRFAADCPFYFKDRIDPLHRGKSHGGDKDRLATSCFALRVAGDAGQFEKLAP